MKWIITLSALTLIAATAATLRWLRSTDPENDDEPEQCNQMFGRKLHDDFTNTITKLDTAR